MYTISFQSEININMKQVLYIFVGIICIKSPVEPSLFGNIKRGKQHPRVAQRTEEDYQKCRSTQARKQSPQALLMVEGNPVLFTCPICLPPKSKARGIWRRLLRDEAIFLPVRLDGGRVRINADLSLEIADAWVADSGVYLCVKESKDIVARYSLEVVKVEPHRYIVMNGRKGKDKGPSSDFPLNGLNLVIGMTWSEWSECSRCGAVGRRRRVGVCMVRKINPKSPSKPEDCRYLNIYVKGIPCRSELLPKAIRDLSIIYNTKSEFVIGFCKIPCPSKASIVVVTDKSGKVVDTVDNSQGVYSMLQPLPELPPFVKRKVVYEEVEKSIIMGCPGNIKGKFLIWRNESFVIDPSKVHKLTHGRVKIDLANNLHIRKLRYSDTATYSCWDDKRLVGTTRLQVVRADMGKNYRFLILNAAVLFTFIVILMIFVTVCKNVRLQSKD